MISITPLIVICNFNHTFLVSFHNAVLSFMFVCCTCPFFFCFLFLSSDNYSKCLQCWSCCKCFGSWRLAFPYIAIGTALMLWPHNLWLSYVAGLLLILLAVLRLCLVFRFSNNSKDEGLLPQCDFEK